MDPTERHAMQRAAMAAAPESDMVRVHAIAGFELAFIFQAWAERLAEDPMPGSGFTLERAGGLGPMCLVPHESYETFGQRMARNVLKLLKEV